MSILTIKLAVKTEAKQLQALDPSASLPAIIRRLIGDDAPEHPDQATWPCGGVIKIHLAQATLDRLEREAEEDIDYELADYVRVRLLDLDPLPEKPGKALATIAPPMVVVGNFTLNARPRLEHKLWIQLPAGISPRRSLRRWLGSLGISERNDEPPVAVVHSERDNSRSASLWLSEAEMRRVREAADPEGVSPAVYLRRVIFSVPVPRDQRVEQGIAA